MFVSSAVIRVSILRAATLKAFHHLPARLRSLSSRIEHYVIRLRFGQLGAWNATSISTWTTRRELSTLYQIATTCPKASIGLEIGAYLGASTCYIAAGLAQIGGHLLCVDTWQNETMPEGERDTFRHFMKHTEPFANITTIRRRSEDLAPSDFDHHVNFVFIDGDHSYEATKRDFELSARLLTCDGIICFHDCEAVYDGPRRVIGEALASGKWLVVGYVDSLLWIKQINEKPRKLKSENT